MKIPDAKAASDKAWEKLENLPAWQMTKVSGKKRGHSRGTERTQDSSYCYADGRMPPQECGVRTEISEIQKAGLYSEVTE